MGMPGDVDALAGANAMPAPPAYWSQDPYWTDALDAYLSRVLRDDGTLTLDLGRIEETCFNGDGVAYRLMETMAGVMANEGEEGFRGAPRLVMAALHRLAEMSDQERPE